MQQLWAFSSTDHANISSSQKNNNFLSCQCLLFLFDAPVSSHGLACWTFTLTFSFIYLDIYFAVHAWVWKTNGRKSPALQWLSSRRELDLHIHKITASAGMRCSPSTGWSLILWDGPYFSCSTAQSSGALAGQWLMSRLRRCSEHSRCTFQDKTLRKANKFTSSLTVYLVPFSKAFREFFSPAAIFIASPDERIQSPVTLFETQGFNLLMAK